MARGAKLPIGLQFHLNPSSFFLLNTTHLLFPIIFISWQEMYLIAGKGIEKFWNNLKINGLSLRNQQNIDSTAVELFTELWSKCWANLSELLRFALKTCELLPPIHLLPRAEDNRKQQMCIFNKKKDDGLRWNCKPIGSFAPRAIFYTHYT